TETLANGHQAGRLVWGLDPQRRFARDGCLDADRGGERERQVILKGGDVADRSAVPGLQLVLGNRRPGVDTDDGRLDIEAGERRLDQLDVRLDLVVESLLPDGDRVQQRQVRLDPLARDLIFDERRRRLIASRYDGQHRLRDGRLLLPGTGRCIFFDRLPQPRHPRFKLRRRGRGWRRGWPRGRGDAADWHEHRLGGLRANHLVARLPGFGRFLLSLRP